MAYAMIPMLVLMLSLGLTMQAQQQVSRFAGADSRAQSAADLRALQAEVFASACLRAAQAVPGIVGANLPVTWPSGVVPLAGATCETRAEGSGRLVLAGVPAVPGAAGELMAVLERSAFWYGVRAPGQAERLANGQVVSVSTAYAVGTLLYQIRISS